MKIRGMGRLKNIAGRITNAVVPRALILLYHRVVDLPSDPQLLCVSPRHFAEHLDILRTHYAPTPLKNIEPSLRHQRVGRPPAVVVTFDDGYADNLYNAKPLLERHEIPATVFTATGYVGSKKEFWYDCIERLFLQPGTLPTTLRLSIGGSSLEWELGECASYSQDSYRSHYLWNVSESHDPTPRHALYRRLHQLLHPLAEAERQKVLDQLLTWAGAGAVGRATHRVLSPVEVLRLVDGGLIEVGSHTVTHPVLSALPAAEQKEEISRSKAHLEEILNGPVISFAYPYGARSHYTAETIAAVREAGYQCACSNFGGTVLHGADLWQLPRFLVRDWDGDEFARRLRNWFRD